MTTTSFHYDGHNYSGKDIDQIDEIIKGKKINTKNINSVSHATKSILIGEKTCLLLNNLKIYYHKY